VEAARFARSWSTRSPRRSSRTTVALDHRTGRRRALPSRKDRGRVQDIGDQRRWLRSLRLYYDVSDPSEERTRVPEPVSSADAVRAKCAIQSATRTAPIRHALTSWSRKKRKLTALMATCATTGPGEVAGQREDGPEEQAHDRGPDRPYPARAAAALMQGARTRSTRRTNRPRPPSAWRTLEERAAKEHLFRDAAGEGHGDDGGRAHPSNHGAQLSVELACPGERATKNRVDTMAAPARHPPIARLARRPFRGRWGARRAW